MVPQSGGSINQVDQPTAVAFVMMLLIRVLTALKLHEY